MTVHQQGLDSLKAQLWNPLAGLTFGGCMQGDNMRPDGAERGRYANTDFKGWRLKTVGAVRKWHLRVFLYRGQTTSADDGLHQIDQLVRRVRREETSSFARTQTWWQAYWKRSYIAINTERPDSASTAWQIGRNYNLFRYQLGCNAYGNFPTKFNGGLFTFDAVYVQSDYLTTPDHRNWGGSAFTAQNQRLVYYPMLKSGDFDLITPQLDFYRNSLGNAELRTAVYWKHKGASFTEQMELFGLPVASEYSWQRPSNYPPGVEYNPWLEYLWDTSLEFCLIALDKQRYNGDDITTYIPLIESCLTFFDEHYQQEALKRTPKALDGNGKLVLFPGSAAETYKGTYNASSTIAGLRVVLERLLALPPSYLSEPQRTHWTGMLQRIPTLPIRVKNGHRVIAPAEAWNRKQNVELPQLYPVYPWGLYGLNKPDLQTAIDTWLYGADSTDQKNHVSWHQDAIFCARLGLTEEAARIETQKMMNSPRRYPTFWGPGHDWVPDHNWGGTGMIGLQEMLMQESEGKIYLFPAWPPEWDVHFKLHAPGQTTVSGTLKNGHLTNLVVNPAVRRKDIIISPDAGIKMDNPSNK